MSTKKTAPKKASKKTIESAKSSKTKAAKPAANKDNKKNNKVKQYDIQNISENTTAIEYNTELATHATEATASNNILAYMPETSASEPTPEPTSTPEPAQVIDAASYTHSNGTGYNEPHINTEIYGNIKAPDMTDRTAFYIGLVGAIILAVLLYFI